MARDRRTVSIATVLALAIGGLVGIAVAAVLAVAFAAGGRNTVDLLGDKASLTLDLAETRLTGHLDPATRQLAFLADLIAARMVDGGGSGATLPPEAVEAALLAAMIQTLASTPQIFGISWWPGDESMTAVARTGEGGAIRTVYRDAPIDGIPEARGARGWLTGLDGPTWGDPAFIPALGESALNLGVPVHLPGPDGAMRRGGLIAIVTVRELSRFIGDLAVAEGVAGALTPFILYGDDRVLAHPALADGAGGLGLSVDRVLPTPADLGDEALAALAEGLWTRAEVQNPGIESRIVDLEGGERIVLTRGLDGYADRPVTLGVHASTAELGAEFFRLMRAGAIGVALLVVAVVVGVLVGRRIARPVQQLAAEAAAVARLDFAQAAPLPVGRLRELADQARAFNTMLAGLAWFETYVPKTLVKRLMAQDAGGAAASEHRDMTVMFTDIAGFTALSEALPAAETAAFLNAHFARLAACVEGEGGTIDKYVGDGMMAFWGAPEDQPDHAARACRAARAIAAAVADGNADRRAAGEPPLRLRIGVHSGPMVVGNIGAPGRINYTIVGDAVNTGQRLEALGKAVAPEAAVVALCSAGLVARLGPDDPRPQPLGPYDLPGRKAAIEVWRLV